MTSYDEILRFTQNDFTITNRGARAFVEEALIPHFVRDKLHSA